MDERRIRECQAQLLTILKDAETGADDTRTGELDQQSVGRLSRMDAIQRQAMAKAQQARHAGAERRIRAALPLIQAGEVGHCTECGDEIAEKRLALDPTAPTCINCAR
ncbi:TraR/DksA family transcriptional regulator [Rhodovulum marinum]|uniref:TraR/DksA family transcriptional regulator n=1 Tax=Rhodovulum marinum TaxID=320662 RepID=A0A4R2Q1F6_9RHOB|nr:TraR/DksA C4-type zinc finger protein [Rhodovulum marinum]TCP42320.1 TraR/DksA family transcriptional regulator [Rhodovulum marinum]